MAKIPMPSRPIAPKGGPRTQANAAAGINPTSKAADAKHSNSPNLAQRAVAGLRDLPWQLNQWNDFFKSWMPGISVTYRVRAQGAPGTSSRDVLHLALAAAFGMSVSRRAASVQITALIDHNNNSVEISYVVSTIAAEFAVSQLLENLPKEGGVKAKIGAIADRIVDNNGFLPISSSDIKDLTSAAYTELQKTKIGDAITGGYREKIEEGQRRNDKLEQELDAVRKAKKIRLAAEAKAAQAKLDAQAKAVNPQVIPKGVPGGTRGINGIAGNVSKDAPWLVARNAVNAAGVEVLKVKMAVQVDKLSLENGPKMLFELAPGQVFSGPAPWILSIRNNSVPFTDMVRDNSPASNNPILTRALAANPQYHQALGTDAETLVAQVLFDPGTMPPLPKTDAGPPVDMDY